MTEAALRKLVEKWDREEPSDDVDATSRYDSMLKRLDWLGETQWKDYLPAQHPEHSARYLDRLAAWVGNVDTDEDRKLLLEYALHVSFFSHADLCALYRTAFTGTITRWLIEQEKLSLDDADFQTRLAEELHQCTWYCPVTDSMDINEFYHANHIVGVTHRPGFALLEMLDEPVKGEGSVAKSRLLKNLERYIHSPNPRTSAPPLKRLVLLEDFVGSGSQSFKALEWAAKNLKLPILFVPLVVCAPGVAKLNEIAAKVRISPLLQLGARDLLGRNRNGAVGIPNAERIETLASDTFERVAGGPHTDRRIAPHTAFGFEETGASFVSYSNTPNNSLPLIHHRPATGGWRPLFPRSARV